MCKCQDKHVHFRLFKHVQNQSFSLLKVSMENPIENVHIYSSVNVHI